jgi:xanthine dehydrogenase small subunit
MRLASLEARGAVVDEAAVRSALLAHLCRCTGWQTVVEAALDALNGEPRDAGSVATAGAHSGASVTLQPSGRDPLLSAWRAQVEGPVFQSSGPEVVMGDAGFACDTAPVESLVAVMGVDDTYRVSPSYAEAKKSAGKVQGRRSTVGLRHPVALPEGQWDLTLQTTWIEPSYLEPDASWAGPNHPGASPLANGGAFGGKRHSSVSAEASRLAEELGQPVRLAWTREDVVRRGPKRPPMAAALRMDGSGVVRVGTSGPSDQSSVHDGLSRRLPGIVIEPVAVMGPPTSGNLRGAGWVEGAVLAAALAARATGAAPPLMTSGRGQAEITAPGGGRAHVTVDGAPGGTVTVEVWAGEILDAVTLRTFCIGAVHQALGWVWSEGIAVADDGEVQDLTIRSFGILAARETPPIVVNLHPDDHSPTNGSDAVFAATAAAAWIADGLAPTWPTRRGRGRESRMSQAQSTSKKEPAS